MSLLMCCTFYLGISSIILYLVNRTIPDPFIDEIFHIPQTQKYCNGSFFEWDNKITTLPGLYYTSLAMQLPLLLLSRDSFCSVLSLRSVNVLFNTFNVALISWLFRDIHKDKTSNKDKESKEKKKDFEKIVNYQALSTATFPLLYFFSFLYYTDPGSTALVLASYLACRKSMHKLSAGLCFCAVLFRQTNIVWVIFMAGVTVAKELMRVKDIEKIETSADIKDKLARFLIDIIGAVTRYLLVLDNLLKIFEVIWPYAAVVGSFIVFVFLNGGIVVGDKTNHTSTFHGPQLLYFLGFTLFFSSPILVSKTQLEHFCRSLKKKPVKFISFGVIFLFLVIQTTQVHLFTLSDNRHYTFYIWKLILQHASLRILLIPVYIYAGWAVHHSLNSVSCTGIWKIVFLVCTAAVTVPQKLIELRYFIIPYLIFRVNVFVEDRRVLLSEFLLYSAVNLFTLCVFFFKTFEWTDEAVPQRIIW